MRTVFLFGIGIVLLIADSLLGRYQVMRLWKSAWIARVDTVIALPETIGKIGWQSVTSVSEETALIQALESRNRALAARVAVLQPFGASASARVMEPTIKAPLSFAGGQWIILAGKEAGVRESALVLVDGTILGTIRQVHRSYAEIETLTVRAIPLLVQHRPSTKTGILSVRENLAAVQFPEKVASIAPLDVLVSVPDGSTTRVSYPVAIVESVSTASAQTTTTVQVRVLAHPVVGQEAAVLIQP